MRPTVARHEPAWLEAVLQQGRRNFRHAGPYARLRCFIRRSRLSSPRKTSFSVGGQRDGGFAWRRCRSGRWPMGSAGWIRPTPTTSPRGSGAFVGRAHGIKAAAVGAAHWQKNAAADERLAGKRGCRRVVARKRGCRRGESSSPVVSCQRCTAPGRIFRLPTSGRQETAIVLTGRALRSLESHPLGNQHRHLQYSLSRNAQSEPRLYAKATASFAKDKQVFRQCPPGATHSGRIQRKKRRLPSQMGQTALMRCGSRSRAVT